MLLDLINLLEIHQIKDAFEFIFTSQLVYERLPSFLGDHANCKPKKCQPHYLSLRAWPKGIPTYLKESSLVQMKSARLLS